MKIIFVIIAIIALSSSLDWETELSKETPEILSQFNDFLNTHEKSYGSLDKMLERLEIFKQNLLFIEELNDLHKDAKFGITRFSDLTYEEFASKHHNNQQNVMDQNQDQEFDITTINSDDMPQSWDWREHGAVTPVKDEGQSGANLQFNVAENLAGQYFLAGNNLTEFSVQQQLDCDSKGMLLDFWKTHGFETAQDYPYNGRRGTCKEKESLSKGTIKDLKLFPRPTDEDIIASYLASKGPLLAMFDASRSFQFYNSGILNPVDCKPDEINHGINIVGYGVSSDTKFWILKNTWGTSWGEKGYARFSRGNSVCNINSQVATISALNLK